MTSKVILISGVTRGLGRAMTDEFIRLGHRVLGCGRSSAAIQELNQEHGPDNRFDVVDVTRDEAVRDWAGRCLEQAGPPDLLLNSAALINRNAPLWEVPAEEFSAVIDVNIKGVANLIRHFAPAMVKGTAGSSSTSVPAGDARPTRRSPPIARPSGPWRDSPRRWPRSFHKAWQPSR